MDRDIEDLKKEVAALVECKIISKKKAERAVAYIDANIGECKEYCVSMGITGAADLIIELL